MCVRIRSPQVVNGTPSDESQIDDEDEWNNSPRQFHSKIVIFLWENTRNEIVNIVVASIFRTIPEGVVEHPNHDDKENDEGPEIELIE